MTRRLSLQHVKLLRATEKLFAALDQIDSPDGDDILSPPVQVPSYKDMPVLRTSFTKPGGRYTDCPAAISEDDLSPSRILEGTRVWPYWGLRLASIFHTYGGGLAIAIGLVVIASAAERGSANDEMAGSAAGMLYAWGLGLILYGIMAVTVGRMVTVLRELAINSFLRPRQHQQASCPTTGQGTESPPLDRKSHTHP